MSRLRNALAVTVIFLLATAVPASAHVTVHSDDAVQGGYGQLAFRVPTESDTAATTGLQVAFPADHRLAFVAVRPHAGWTYKVVKSAVSPPLVDDDGNQVAEAVSEIDWTATGPDSAIRPGEYDEFLVEAGPLPKVDRLEFRVVQTYSDGTVVRWIDPGQSEHPAPALSITAGSITAPSVQPVAASAASPPWALGAATAAVLIAAGSVALAWRRTSRRARPTE
jgi:uncharacterized protein YcnI